MAYVQNNYSQKLGTGPYPIAEVGCFLTSFSNLLARFGENIDPPSLNNFFIQHNTFMHDPTEPAGTKDNLGWGSVSAYDSNLVVSGTGGAGWPDSNDAIVKFEYVSIRSGRKTTHFALVQDHAQHLILDPWDGVIKNPEHISYGTPVAWAKYERHQPQVVTKPAPAADPAFSVEAIDPIKLELKSDTHLWDLNQRSWPGLVNNPVAVGNKGTQFVTSTKAHHIVGGSYYIPDGCSGQGYNVVDCEAVPVAAPAPTPPVPTPTPKTYTENTVDGITYTAYDGDPKRMWVIKPEGAEKWTFNNVKLWRDFKSVQHVPFGTEVFIVGEAHHPIPPKGATYLMQDGDFGDFKTTGKVKSLCGFNKVDLSETRPDPKEEPTAKPTPTPTPVPAPKPVPVVTAPVTTTAPSAPEEWKASYQSFGKPVKYVATRDLIVTDLSRLDAPTLPLKRYDPLSSTNQGVIDIYGVVWKDGTKYYRARITTDTNFQYWYCIPTVDSLTKAPLLLVYQQPVRKVTTRDSWNLLKSELEENTLNFIDDMIPAWLKSKK